MMRKSYLRALRACALAGLLAASLTGCGLPESERISVVSKAMSENLPKDFADLSFSVLAGGNSLLPQRLAFSGVNSTILAQNGPYTDRDYGFLDTPYNVVEIQVLAITKNGRYFTFTYRSRLDSRNAPSFLRKPCLDSDCRGIKDEKAVSREDAMHWFFESHDYSPARFEQIFGEPGPAKKVDA